MVMTFSEFGRRVAQNASGGTDHGAAAPMFMFGGGVKPGVYGKYPSLTHLYRGGDLQVQHGFPQRVRDGAGALAEGVERRRARTPVPSDGDGVRRAVMVWPAIT